MHFVISGVIVGGLVPTTMYVYDRVMLHLMALKWERAWGKLQRHDTVDPSKRGIPNASCDTEKTLAALCHKLDSHFENINVTKVKSQLVESMSVNDVDVDVVSFLPNVPQALQKTAMKRAKKVQKYYPMCNITAQTQCDRDWPKMFGGDCNCTTTYLITKKY